MGREKLALFVLLMANLPRVEDFFNQGTCNWICSADTDIDKESRDMLANGRLVKFRVLNEERVHSECANQTDVTNSSTRASLWLKMAASNKPAREKRQGRLQFFTQSILEGIFSGQFAFGDYKEINVSCIFKSTSVTKSVRTNYSSLLLTFHTSQSVLYLVEPHLTNDTKPNATFLTLLRMENNTGLSVGVTGSSGRLSSAKSANDNELVVTDRWLLVAVIIWTVFLLYSPVIFISLRPSEIKLKVPGDARKSIYPSETADDVSYIETETREGHVPPIEHDESDSAGSHEGSEIAEGAFSQSKTQHEGSGTPGSPVVETKRPSDEDSEMTLPRLKGLAHLNGRVNIPKTDQERKLVGLTRGDDDLPPELNDSYVTPGLDGGCLSTSSSKHRSTSTCDGSLGNGTTPTGSYQESNDEMLSSDGRFDAAVTNKSADKELSTSSRNDEDLSVSDGSDEELIPFNRNDKEWIASNRDDAKLASTSKRNDEKQIASNRNDEGRSASHRNGDIDTRHVVDIRDQSSLTNEDALQKSGVQSPHEEETEYVSAIIVGGTYPVGFGSCIGNKLFSTTKRNHFYNMVKLIFIFFVPSLFFVGLGDFFLALLPNLHSRLADHLPFPFLTSSLVYGIIDNNPIVLVLIVFSAISYLIRLFFLCFLSSSTPVETAWKSCSVHRMHPTCLSYKLLQRFLSVFPPPKSICNLNRVCNRHHLKCTVCHWFHNTCLSFKPCENCKKTAPSECSKYLSLPDNVSHNLEKHPDIVIKYMDSFFECLSNFGETKSIASSLKVIFSPLAVVPLIIDIFFSTPLVCLCHGRLWMLTERYKDKFKGSRFIFPILECLLIFFSQVWVTFLSLLSAIPLGVATVGLVKVLGSHTTQVLPHVVIALLVMYFFWCCYRSFAAPYRDLAKFLASRYQKRFDEREKNPGVNVLIHYKQGDLKVIPRELFDDACKEFKLLIKNEVALLFVKLGLTLLVFMFVFPILGSDDVFNPQTPIVVIGFLSAGYDKINNAINGGEFKVSEVVADNVVDNYIARKQDSS